MSADDALRMRCTRCGTRPGVKCRRYSKWGRITKRNSLLPHRERVERLRLFRWVRKELDVIAANHPATQEETKP